jgi:hypothetical protein
MTTFGIAFYQSIIFLRLWCRKILTFSGNSERTKLLEDFCIISTRSTIENKNYNLYIIQCTFEITFIIVLKIYIYNRKELGLTSYTCEQDVSVFLHKSVNAVADFPRVVVDHKPVKRRFLTVVFTFENYCDFFGYPIAESSKYSWRVKVVFSFILSCWSAPSRT